MRAAGTVKVLIIAALMAMSAGCAYYVETPPPAPLVEVRPVVPFPGAVWVGGYYVYRNGYVWVPGRYMRPPRPHAYWVPGNWERHHHRGWYWRDGHWK